MLLRDTTRIKRDFWRKDMDSKKHMFQYLVISLEDIENELESLALYDDGEDDCVLKGKVELFNTALDVYGLKGCVDALSMTSCVLDDVYKCREQVAEWFNN